MVPTQLQESIPPKPVQKFCLWHKLLTSLKVHRVGAAASLAYQGMLEPQSTYRDREEIQLWADFAIMMECTTQESGRCHSVCTLWMEL